MEKIGSRKILLIHPNFPLHSSSIYNREFKKVDIENIEICSFLY